MSITQSDVGAVQILNKYFKDITPSGGTNYYLKLFVNDVTPVDSFTASNFTEAAGGGYAAKTIAPTDATVSIQSGVPQAAFPQQSFVFTGPLTTNTTVYGYYVVDADGVLVFSDRASAPYTPANSGDLFAITATYKLSAGTPA